MIDHEREVTGSAPSDQSIAKRDVAGHCPTSWADFAGNPACSLPHADGCMCPSKGDKPYRPCPCHVDLVSVVCGCGAWLVTPEMVDSPCGRCDGAQRRAA